ncbi:MAG: glycosyltransferase [Rhodospirillales bacterium]|nr:MAG: glycosyltransferase [Rhodospirillales bacterium]
MSGYETLNYPQSESLLERITFKPDLLHVHNLHGNYFDLRELEKLSRRLPVVLTLHDAWLLAGHCAHSFSCVRWKTGCGSCPRLDIYPEILADNSRNNLRFRVELFSRSRLWVATPSQWLMDKVRASRIWPHVMGTKVIPNGFDLSVFTPGDKMEARRRLDLPQDKTILLFSANGIRSNVWKDFASMRLVLARLGALMERPPLLLALGETGEDEQLGAARISFRPFEPDGSKVADYYRAADLYLHMSLADTFPNVIAEALCCGLPVGATAVGGILEQVRSLAPLAGCEAQRRGPANGLLVASGDVEGMAGNLAELLTQPGLLSFLSANALEDRALYSHERMTGDYLDWFEEILHSQKSEAGMSDSKGPRISGWRDSLSEALAEGRPVNRVFGLNRGMPIDRHYIERFLACHAADLRGRALEISEPTYTQRFGGERVTQAQVLTAASDRSPADFKGDIADPATLPADAFDTMILVQTLHCIYDVKAALAGARRALKPGGVLLATLPGITQVSRYDMDRWGDFWRMTSKAAGRLFAEVFHEDEVEVTCFGNAAAATAFLNGLAVEDMPEELLDLWDPDYEMLIGVRVRKRPATGGRTGSARLRLPFDPPVILMYHRVADLASDPQCLAVSPSRFDDHMRLLSSLGRPVALENMAAIMEEGQLPERAFVVTFDDGYEDNLTQAKPVLEHYGIPATVFVTAGMVGGDREFWWDELERLLLLPGRLPDRFSVTLESGETTVELGAHTELDEKTWRDLAAWTVLDETDPTPRHTLYRLLHRLIYQIGDDATRQSVLHFVRSWAGREATGRLTHRVLGPKQIGRLAEGGLVEVGAHTLTHPVLSALGAAEQRREILESRRLLEEWAGRSVRAFAYPYGGEGSFTDETVGMLKEAGFHSAAATFTGAVRRTDRLFALPRLCVRNWSAEELRHQIEACRAE